MNDRAHAYFVIWIDLDSMTVVKAGVYSEARPTTYGKPALYPVLLETAAASTYEAAARRVRTQVWPAFRALPDDTKDG